MNAKHQRIVEQRKVLLTKIALQRQSLRVEVEAWAGPLSLVDRGLGVVRYIKRHPLLAVAAVSLLLPLSRRGRGGTWLGRGLIAWRLLNRFNRLGGGGDNLPRVVR